MPYCAHCDDIKDHLTERCPNPKGPVDPVKQMATKLNNLPKEKPVRVDHPSANFPVDDRDEVIRKLRAELAEKPQISQVCPVCELRREKETNRKREYRARLAG